MDENMVIKKREYKKLKNDITSAIAAMALKPEIGQSVHIIRSGVTIENDEIIMIMCNGDVLGNLQIEMSSHIIKKITLVRKLFYQPFQCFATKSYQGIKDMLESYVGLEIEFEES